MDSGQTVDKSSGRVSKTHIVVQSLLAIIAITVILFFVESLMHTAIVIALGASAFIVFAMPRSVIAQPRRLIGGHVIGLTSGLLCYYLFFVSPFGRLGQNREEIFWFASALAVGLSIFLMAVTGTGHPPAASTALAFVVQQWSYQTVAFVLLCAGGLAIAGRLLKGRLTDLF